jgi:hypothetical protein
VDPQLDDLVDDDEERHALEAEFKRLYAEQARLKMTDDLEAWKRHIAALIDYQARVERRRQRQKASTHQG